MLERRNVFKALAAAVMVPFVGRSVQASTEPKRTGLTANHINRVLYRKSFYDFAKAAWPLVNSDPFDTSPQTELIIREMERFAKTPNSRLLVHLPPATYKSTIMSVLYPAWKWTWEPEAGFVCQSYMRNLASRDATASRRLVESEWYQSLWPEVRIEKDDSVKGYFRTSAGGFRLSTTHRLSLTGVHPTDIISDGPIDIFDAEYSWAEWRDWMVKTVGSRGVTRSVRIAVATNSFRPFQWPTTEVPRILNEANCGKSFLGYADLQRKCQTGGIASEADYVTAVTSSKLEGAPWCPDAFYSEWVSWDHLFSKA